ncbi:MAG: hypothetical protein JSV09_11865 [Thermoplasmata archaeon]|nr:MAG: hypothetical protein JSV09_11865 [Thermoplasmata archaeon]
MQETVETVANLMALSAITAPKTRGQDVLKIKVLLGEEKDKVANEMLKIAKERDIPGFTRDGNNVKDSDVLLLFGLSPHDSCGFDCRACGFDSCGEFDSTEAVGDFAGPNCAFRLLDLGIALGSAVKTASIHNVDNRIMYRVGIAASRMDIMDSNIIMGVPLSVSGKSIFFDRKT